jgi:Response regulators consisting of a CheY-like receiver domain and a winged-helix DNA-binding domain
MKVLGCEQDMRVFLLEDDLSLKRGLSLKLEKEGHEVVCAGDIASAEKHLREAFDFAMVDINLPDGSGLDILKSLRAAWPGLHILMLTANDAETDIVTGYELGTDDYMTKPFSLSVLLSKVNAVQRRLSEGANALPLGFDSARQTVVIQGKQVNLTKNETRLLDAFLTNIGQILTKEQLLQRLFDIDSDFVDENTLAVNIARLRGKIEDDVKNPRLIENVRGVGYRLNGACL